MQTILHQIFQDQPIKFILSNPVSKNGQYKKVVISQMSIKGELCFQVESFTTTQAFHQNLSPDEVMSKVQALLENDFKQADIFTVDKVHHLKISKKGKVFHSTTKASHEVKVVQHNRKKCYHLPENTFIEPLYDLGVISKDGKVNPSMYDKYKQINRFIEMVDNCLSDELSSLNIIDFGCGKSYLTFILYYYLTTVRKMNVTIIGLDLKKEVIAKCNDIAKRYHYDQLRFEVGDINGYNAPFDVDMVVSLHACDTATDHAIYNAIKWNAKIILSVPCCQHELNCQIQTDEHSLITKYGLIKERTSALLTDAIRANLVEAMGYKVQLLEFIDLSHSPKNILIRAIKSNISSVKKEKALHEVETLMKDYHLNPCLYRLLFSQTKVSK